MKKIVTLLMAVALIFSLSACDSSGQRQDTVSTLEPVSELQQRDVRAE